MLKLLTHPEPHSFTFDAVAAEDVDQEGIFQGWPGDDCAPCGSIKCSVQDTRPGCHLLVFRNPA